MLSKVFGKRPRFDDADPAARRAAVEAVDRADEERFTEELVHLAVADPDLEVRCAAIRHLTVAAPLEALLEAGDPRVESASADRLAELSEDMPRLLEIAAVRNARIRQATDPETVSELIDALHDPGEIIELAATARNTKVRLALARRLRGEAELTELERRTRSRDKTVNRFARTHLEDLRQDEAQHAKTLRRADQLIQSIELAASGDETPSAAQLGALAHSFATNLERLRELTGRLIEAGIAVATNDALEAQFEAALARAQDAAARRESEPPVPNSAASDFGVLLEEIRGFDENLRSGTLDPWRDAETIRECYTDIGARWSATSDHEPPPDDLAEQYHVLIHGFAVLFTAIDRLAARAPVLEKLRSAVPDDQARSSTDYRTLWRLQRRGAKACADLDAELSKLDWPGAHPEPQLLAEIRSLTDGFRSFSRRCDERAQDLETKAEVLIGALDAHISDGQLDEALNADQELRGVLRDLPEVASRRLRHEAQPLESRLQELKDWRNFATSPKREALLGEMRALIDSGLEPAAQADRIKVIRASWNALGPVTNHHDRRIYEQFNQAAEQAFAPCRAHYAEQAKQREFNLEQRQAICTALATYLADADWSTVDWKGAEQILRTARDEWHRFHPVDRGPGRKLKVRFDALTNELHGHIKSEWDRNVAFKQELIDAAEEIARSEQPVRQATDAIKALQQRWRTIGITPRRVDQRLWKSFRAACDAVFERRDQQRTAHDQSRKDAAEAAETLCDEFQREMDDAAADAVDEAVLKSFRQRFHDLGELPKNRASQINRRFDELERSYRALLRDAAQHARLATLQRWRALDETLTDLERKAAAGEPFEEPTADSLGLPVEGFAHRLERLAEGVTDSPEESNAQRRRLAIEAEIAARLDSPGADQQQRLELQVERLNRGMSGVRDVDDPLALVKAWCAIPAGNPPDDDLRERFFAALRRLAE